MNTTDLGHRERTILATLHGHLVGIPVQAPALTVDEYVRAVTALQVLGLVGAEGDGAWTHGTIRYVRRCWLTPEGRRVARGM